MPDIAHQRLFQQALIDSPFRSPATVVSWLGAVQAQDYPAALWALALRLPGSTPATIEQPICGTGDIIRTWLMRGTLHFAALG